MRKDSNGKRVKIEDRLAEILTRAPKLGSNGIRVLKARTQKAFARQQLRRKLFNWRSACRIRPLLDTTPVRQC